MLEAADAVLAVRRVPEKLIGCLDMHAATEAALGPLQVALAVNGSRLEHRSMGLDRPALVGQLSQVCVGPPAVVDSREVEHGLRCARHSTTHQPNTKLFYLHHHAHTPLQSPHAPSSRSCAVGWWRRRAAALGSCRTRCRGRRPRACPQTARCVVLRSGWAGCEACQAGQHMGMPVVQ